MPVEARKKRRHSDAVATNKMRLSVPAYLGPRVCHMVLHVARPLRSSQTAPKPTLALHNHGFFHPESLFRLSSFQ